MPLYKVDIKIAGSGNNEFWIDTKRIHKNIELPEIFILEQADGDKILVTQVKTLKTSTWGKDPRYSRISLFNITKGLPVTNPPVFTVQLELPEPVKPTRWEHLENHEEVEIVIGSCSTGYGGETMVLNDNSKGWLKTHCPFKATVAKTGKLVIVTSSSSEHRGGHGEGNISLTSISITDLDTMKTLPKDTVLKYSGIVVRPVEVVDQEKLNKIKETEVFNLVGIEKIISQFNKG